MAISKTGCSKSITKDDLKSSYYQGYKDCVEILKDKEKEAYNQALEDAEERFKKWIKSEYGKVADDDILTIRVLRSLKK